MLSNNSCFGVAFIVARLSANRVASVLDPIGEIGSLVSSRFRFVSINSRISAMPVSLGLRSNA